MDLQIGGKGVHSHGDKPNGQDLRPQWSCIETMHFNPSFSETFIAYLPSFLNTKLNFISSLNKSTTAKHKL